LARAAAADSSDYQTLQNLALAHIGSGDYASALNEIAKVISEEKNKPGWDAVFIHAIAMGESGDYDLAARELQSVRTASPSLTEAQTDAFRFQGLADHRPETALPPLAIPYSKLVAKSNAWPVFP
jgi:Flp pilus assembly protein TadD